LVCSIPWYVSAPEPGFPRLSTNSTTTVTWAPASFATVATRSLVMSAEEEGGDVVRIGAEWHEGRGLVSGARDDVIDDVSEHGRRRDRRP
jgi:hypothetical protein